MKKQVLFVALATIFSMSVFAQEAVRPDTAYGVSHEEEDVLPLYCNHYTGNNLNYYVFGWGGVTTWETLKLGVDSTNVMYCQDMKWDIMGTSTDNPAVSDFSAFKKLHFDVWVPEARHINLTFETATGAKPTCHFQLNAGWNTIDAEPAWWKDANDQGYDFKDVKFLIFEKYKKVDSEILDSCSSAEGTPFAFANIYWWNDPAPKNIPATAPAAPTMAEAYVMALFSTTYATNNFKFAPQAWGGENWVDYEYANGQHIWYAEDFTWDAFTNWDASSYALPENPVLDFFHADVYVTVDSKLKFTFEALGTGDGGSGWKNGLVVEGLQANQWNSVDIDLLNAPFDSYNFTDLRYLILEGFTKAEGGSAEHTPLAIANAYFYDSSHQDVEKVEANQVATKRLVDGKLVIIKNGVQYNVLGTQF